MYKFILKRIFFMVITLFAVCALTFFLMNTIPGGNAETILKHTVMGLEEAATYEQLTDIIARYNLKDPLYIQFFRWLENGIVHGDIGTSYVYHKPVVHLIGLHLPATLLLAISSMSIAIFIGIPFGIYCALKENKTIDNIIRLATTLGASMPGFWIGLLLILIFAVTFKLVTVAGYGKIEDLVLPSITLAIHPMAVIVRMTRTSMLETLGSEYIMFATAKGLPLNKIISRHALKSTMLPIITLLGLQMGHILGGAMVIENIFDWPGIGSLLVNSILARDLPVVQSCVLIIVVMFLCVNFIVDILYTYLNPRIRFG